MNDQSWCTTTPGLHNDGCDCAKHIQCPGCRKKLKRTANGKYRKHNAMPDEECDFSRTEIPQEDEWQGYPQNAKTPNATSAASSEDAATDPARSATPSTSSGPSSPEQEGDASTPAALPGVDTYARSLGDLTAAQQAEYRAKVEAGLAPAFSGPVPDEADQPPLFSDPSGRTSEAPAQEVSDFDRELAARLKEMFYAYDNRRSADNRGAQATMGPSEMGTPCDRRLALSLLRMPPVNPGGDGWAAFVGTCIHEGLARMFLWANAGTGRFAVEQSVTFDSEYVPHGTTDLIDRTLFLLGDHKCQGRWSRNKLRSQGISPTYRVQAHVYAHGARKRGENIERVAVISWPRDEATLDDLLVKSEPYNPSVVKAAFERVERVGDEVESKQEEMRRIYPGAEDIEIRARVGINFNINTESCRFCPFYLPNARDITKGCNGRR